MAITLGADDKKKIYILGALAGALGLVGVVFILHPFGGGKPADDGATGNSLLRNVAVGNNATSNAAVPGRPTNGAPVLPPGGNANFGANAGMTRAISTSTPDPSTLTPQIPGIGRTRNDPFVPVIVPALPPPPPAPPTRTLVREAVPVSLPSYAAPASGSEAGLPSTMFSPSAQSNIASTTLYLPTATIFSGTQSTAPAPLPTIGGLTVGAPGAQTSATNASGKRVAGVILGDSIRALIEYQENGQTVSKIVQPGDEVGGMKILSIQRVRSGDQSIVRVTARENGQDEFFDLGPGS